MPVERSASVMPDGRPPEGSDRINPTSHVLKYLKQQLETVSIPEYQQLTHLLSRASIVKAKTPFPFPSFFDHDSRRFLRRLPVAFSIAVRLHADIPNHNTPLAEIIDMANRALYEDLTKEPNKPTRKFDSRVRHMIKEELIARQYRVEHRTTPATTLVEFPHAEKLQVVEIEHENSGLLEALDRQLEDSSPQEYQALLRKLQIDAKSGALQDSDTVFVGFLPKALEHATKYARRKGADWRFFTQHANYALYSYIEDRDPNGNEINLKKIKEHLARTFKKDLDNPFINADEMPMLAFKGDPKENEKDQDDQTNILAIKRARMAKRVKSERSEKGEISRHTRKILESWGVSEESILERADRLIQEGQVASDTLSKKYQTLLDVSAEKLNSRYRIATDNAYSLLTVAFMELIYENDSRIAPFEALLRSQLINRALDSVRAENKSDWRRGPKNIETRRIFRYLEEHGLGINPKNLDKAILMTGSSISSDEALARYPNVHPAISIENLLGNTRANAEGVGLIVAQDYIGVLTDHTSLEDPTLREAIDETAPLMEIILDLKTLDERDKKVLTEYYVNGRTLIDIAKELGVSESRVSRMHLLALSRIRSAAHGNESFRIILKDAFAA